MSSGFVSGGTTEKPTERDDEWLKAQQEIEDNRRRKEEDARQQGGKSLYEVLQNNKAAKEEAFQESIKLKNQFRNLDEDEVEFLDSVLESTRAKEQAVKRETLEQLDLFRRQQEEAEKALLDEGDNTKDTAASPTGPSADTQWALNAKKRKRKKEEGALTGVKLRKSSSATEDSSKSNDKSTSNSQASSNNGVKGPSVDSTKKKKIQVSNTIVPNHGGKAESSEYRTEPLATSPLPEKPAPTKAESVKTAPSSVLGLADYGSDDD